jgi:hypothetical protein
MAKNKNSAALFEVINRGKPMEARERARSSVLTPKWWFKSSQASGSSAAASSAVATEAPATTTEAAESPSPNPSADTTTLAIPSATPLPARNSVAFDPDRHSVFMQLSYTAAIIICFAVVVVMVLCFLIGRNFGRRTIPVAAINLEQLRNYPPYPNAMEVPRGNGTSPRVNEAPANGSEPPAPQGTAQPQAAPPTSSPLVVHDEKRQVGLNYVIVQSYPEDQLKIANEARDALIKSGVPCTVEKGPQGWVPMTWYSVIGTAGFTGSGLRSGEYEAYVKSIEAVSTKFATTPGNAKFKKFEPRPKKWTETN